MHGFGGLGNLADALHESIGKVVLGANGGVESRQFGGIGEASVPKKEYGFLEGAVLSEITDRYSDVFKNTLFAIDERELGI